MVKENMHAEGENVNKPNSKGLTPVCIAAQHGHAEKILSLKAAGANVDAPFKVWTPVFIAAQNGHAEAITALKTAGANVNTPNWTDMHTPAHIAAEKGHANVIRALYAAGANMNAKNNFDKTPLHIAAKNGHVEAVSALLEVGADASIRYLFWWTALDLAKRGKEPKHQVVVNLLEANLKSNSERDKLMSIGSNCKDWLKSRVMGDDNYSVVARLRSP